MKNKILSLIFALGSYSAYSQVVIGKQDPTLSAQLEVYATDMGMLIPRVALTGSTDATSITKGNVNSLLVFNTAAVLDITPGYYYWYTNKWNRLMISGEASDSIGDVTFDPTNSQFSYIDSTGIKQPIDMGVIVKANQTITTLIKDIANDGKYVYTNEGGTPTTIDVVSDVITNATTIFGNADVITEIDKIIQKDQTLTSLNYDATGNTLIYKDENEGSNNIDIDTLVKANETKTTLNYTSGDAALIYTGENSTTTVNLANVSATTTPSTVLAVTGTAATFTPVTVDIIPSAVVGDVLTTSEAGVVSWKAIAKPNFLGIKVISADYILGDDDYTIIAKKLTNDIAITLPDATANTGRVLVINQMNVSKSDGTAVKVNFNTNVIYSDSSSYPYITASLFGGVTKGSAKITLQSDGTDWYVITYAM